MTPEPVPERRIDAAYLRPLTIADVLDGMFELLTANWRAYLIALGVILVPLNFVVSYLTSEVYGGTGLLEMLNNPAMAEAIAAGGPRLGPFLGLVAVSIAAFVLATPLANGAACWIAAEGYAQRQASGATALREALRRYLVLVAVTLLLALAMVAVFAIPALLGVGAAVGESAALAVLAVGLAVAAVPLAIFVFVRLCLAYVVVIVEGAGPWTAVRRSWRLVAGRFWRVFATLLLTGLVATFVAYIVAVPFTIAGSLFGDWGGVVLSTIGGVVAAVLSTPLSANVQVLVYFDSRVRVEAYDLDVLSRRLVPTPTERAFG